MGMAGDQECGRRVKEGDAQGTPLVGLLFKVYSITIVRYLIFLPFSSGTGLQLLGAGATKWKGGGGGK